MSACDLSQSLPCDAGVAHPEWVDTIKIEALNAYADAFTSLPVIVDKYHPTWLYGGTTPITDPPFFHTVYIQGGWLEDGIAICPVSGRTDTNTWSRVYYLASMCGAQDLGPSPSITDPVALRKLAIAIGKGIGRLAAHETGHQLSFASVYPYPVLNLDCGKDNGWPCEKGIDSVFEYWKASSWTFEDWNPPIHWQSYNQCRLTNWFLNRHKDDCGNP